VGFVKPNKFMEKQVLINAVGTLSGTLDALNRAGEKEAIKEVVSKMLELVKQL
jgi:hypothetical protein